MPGKKSKKTLVIGLGISGKAVAAFLARRGHEVHVVDSSSDEVLQQRAAELSTLGIQVGLGVKDLPLDVDLVVTSPGIPPLLLAPYREKKIPVVGELEIGCNEIQVPIVAVTGTNGKSTVVTNIAEGLRQAGRKAAAIGNLGTPITEWIDSGRQADVVVIEVSSYQLETIETFHPHIAVILNIAPDHLGHHGSMEAYVAAKARILQNQTIEDVLLLHRSLSDFPILQKTRGRLFWYGRDLKVSLDGLTLTGNQLAWRGGGPEWSRGVNTEGYFPHDVENIMACVAVLATLGVDVDQAVRLFEHPVRLPHRLELVAAVGGVTYINDSKATNAHAAIAALFSTEGPLIWLVGGQGKGEDLAELAAAARERKPRRVVCFGQDRHRFRDALAGHLPVEVKDSLQMAFAWASGAAAPGDTVLLAPASASFDEFNSFEDRGEHFRKWVHELEARSS
ncbi:MAG: UDP-N-acetylmuramoylalanine--D-glutamate ligase [Candidatus Hinthialibacteria bacterium OLB16]|nr:MAG: UDP-N-acetylmuramoylalanine--D-glutamate ligase [Candidatus Hinthialibacteria bacterium OLB16]